MKTPVILAITLLSATACSQPFKLGWSRLSTAADIDIDEMRTGLVDSQGRIVVAGSTLLPNGKRVANISLFNRNRALIKSVQIAPSGDASMRGTRLMEEEGIFYFFCTRTETVGNNESITLYKLDSQLNTLGSTQFAATAAPGSEVVTGAVWDDTDIVHVVGIASEGTVFRTFLTRLDPATLQASTIELPELANSAWPPSIALGANSTVAVGSLNGEKARIRAFTQAHAAKWELGEFDAITLGSRISNLTSFGGDFYVSLAKNQDFEVENDETHWSVQRISASNGGILAENEWPPLTGLSMVSPGPLETSPAGIFASYWKQGRTLVKRLDANLMPLNSYELSSFPLEPRSMLVDSFGEVFLCGNQLPSSPNALGAFKLNAVLAQKVVFTASDWDFATDHDAGSAKNDLVGEFYVWETDGRRSRLSCYQQAPIAVTDGVFQPRSGRVFRPLAPVTANDRYAGLASISIAVPPAHGTVTIGANGYFNYTADPGYVGPDSFKYKLSKPGLTESVATVNLSVRP